MKNTCNGVLNSSQLPRSKRSLGKKRNRILFLKGFCVSLRTNHFLKAIKNVQQCIKLGKPTSKRNSRNSTFKDYIFFCKASRTTSSLHGKSKRKGQAQLLSESLSTFLQKLKKRNIFDATVLSFLKLFDGSSIIFWICARLNCSTSMNPLLVQTCINSARSSYLKESRSTFSKSLRITANTICSWT